MKSLASISAFILLFFHSFSFAADDPARDVIIQSLAKIKIDASEAKIGPTPIPGIYQVVIGAEVLYVTEDGQHAIQGEIFNILEQDKIWSVTEETESGARSEILKTLTEDDVITFAPKNKAKGETIYVFTDITCGYCRKLHKDVPELNNNGVTVKYLAFPRGGAESTGAFELSAVWCAEDRNKAMTDAKAGMTIDINECKNPVASQYELGNSFGVNGTPAIFLENGYRVPGYQPPDMLLKIIKEKSGSGA